MSPEQGPGRIQALRPTTGGHRREQPRKTDDVGRLHPRGPTLVFAAPLSNSANEENRRQQTDEPFSKYATSLLTLMRQAGTFITAKKVDYTRI